MSTLTITIDGDKASGKTTLAAILRTLLKHVIAMDVDCTEYLEDGKGGMYASREATKLLDETKVHMEDFKPFDRLNINVRNH